MRVVLITQDDPFFLPAALDHLLRRVPTHSEIVACVVLGASPFGKRKSPLEKVNDTINVFGLAFFIRYGIHLVRSKLFGRSVRSVLTKHGVPILAIKGDINSKHSRQAVATYAPDLLISIAANQIFKRELIELAPQGTLNLHTALLPKYRGLMPSFWVLRNDERETGVSVFFVDDGIDSGPILVQKRIPTDGMTQEALIRKAKFIGMDSIVEAMDLIHAGDYSLLPNRKEEATYYSFPTAADVNEFRRLGKRFY